jgi:hypothetical protein
MIERKQVPHMHYQSDRTSLPSRALIAGVTALVVLMVVVSLGPSVSRASAPTAHGAKTVSLNESGSLHLTSKHGFTLNEAGTASGTISGTIYVHLKIVSTSHVTAEVSIYPKGGSVTGYGTASYHKEKTSGDFSGTMTVNRGTGSYNNARGSGLSFSGTIQRSNDAVTVHVAGTVTD